MIEAQERKRKRRLIDGVQEPCREGLRGPGSQKCHSSLVAWVSEPKMGSQVWVRGQEAGKPISVLPVMRLAEWGRWE